MVNEFVSLIPRQAKKYGDKEALRFRDYETSEWVSWSWIDFEKNIEAAALALCAIGVEEQGKVTIFSQNCPEILTVHFASFRNRAASVPIYATSSKDEAAYIVNDSCASVIFTGDQHQYEIALQLLEECPSLKHIVTFDPKVVRVEGDETTLSWQEFINLGANAGNDVRTTVEQRSANGSPDDIMYLIYTSGTTGVPKGVMLTHSNWNAAMKAHAARITNLNDETDISLSFLPFSHVFELGWSMVCLTHGVRLAINLNPKEIQKAVSEIRPTCMCSVPRFWEKVYTAVNDNLQHAKPVVKMLIKRAIAVGKKRNVKYLRTGKKVPALLEKQYQYFDKKVFSKLRSAIGFDNPKMFPTAGAMLSDNITEFLHAVGINIVIGYGLSETTASVSFYKQFGFKIGTIGTPLASLQVKIGENNEILVKGPSVMKGYYNRPEESEQAFTADGYLRTGDAGRITPEGELVITERLKDLFKTSNGKYIAPQALESLLAEDQMIEQVAVIGEQRKFVTALIVPAYAAVEDYAHKNKIGYNDMTDLLKNPAIIDMFMNSINEIQSGLASYEQIKRITLLPKPFTMESGELTNTLKVRRNVVMKNYKKQIDAMYAY